MKNNNNLKKQYRFDEYLAKVILEKKIFDNRRIFEVKDKPDLQNDKLKIGIEVTTAVEESTKELEELYIKLVNGNTRNKKKTKEKIETMGGKILNYVLVHPVRQHTLENIYIALDKKLKILNNDNYEKFEHYYVFITDNNIIHKYKLDKIINTFQTIQKDYECKFEKIYVYSYGNNLYEFDLEKKIYTTYMFLHEEMFNISVEAERILEDDKKKN